MSYIPNNGVNLRASVFGVSDPSNLDLYGRRMRGPSPSNTLALILISAILFIAVISLYDVLKIMVSNEYATRALLNPNSHNSPNDIERTLIANTEMQRASLVFSCICVGLAIVLIPLLLLSSHSKR
jgi:hypothetical protein